MNAKSKTDRAAEIKRRRDAVAASLAAAQRNARRAVLGDDSGPAPAWRKPFDVIGGMLGRVDWAHVRERLTQYALLARMHKPIGILLLLWPTWWALWLAAGDFPPWQTLVIFTLGVFLMRSAGCVINDYADRNLDPEVKRTRDRPIATAARDVAALAAAPTIPGVLMTISAAGAGVDSAAGGIEPAGVRVTSTDAGSFRSGGGAPGAGVASTGADSAAAFAGDIAGSVSSALRMMAGCGLAASAVKGIFATGVGGGDEPTTAADAGFCGTASASAILLAFALAASATLIASPPGSLASGARAGFRACSV